MSAWLGFPVDQLVILWLQSEIMPIMKWLMGKTKNMSCLLTQLCYFLERNFAYPWHTSHYFHLSLGTKLIEQINEYSLMDQHDMACHQFIFNGHIRQWWYLFMIWHTWYYSLDLVFICFPATTFTHGICISARTGILSS